MPAAPHRSPIRAPVAGTPPAEHLNRLAASRAAVLAAIGEASDVTLVRGAGNLGDALIWSGAREQLGDRVDRELTIEQLGGSDGELAVFAGSGALCRPYHEWKPHAIAVAELRYERVIVLPSSVDPGEDRVRDLLARTSAIVFCRERESLRAIEDLCDARLALDCAFHLDYEPHRAGPGAGVLNAFRTDAERRPGHPLPDGNDDISVTAGSVDDFLRRIAAAERVRTDRAHVMIAAALLGKPVAYAASSYHKLPGLASWALSGFEVSRIADPPPPRRRVRRRPWWRRRKRARVAGVAAVIATRDRPHSSTRAVASVLASAGTSAVVVDSNSSPSNRRQLAAMLPDDRVRLLALDRDRGRAGARNAGVARVAGDSILLLDQDVTLERGALRAMTRDLRNDRDAVAVSATVIAPDGAVEHSGGTVSLEGEVAVLVPADAGCTTDAVAARGAGRCQWVPQSALLVRAAALARMPLAFDVDGFEDQDWALRALAAGVPVRRSVDALAQRHRRPEAAHAVPFAERMRRLELASSLARIHRRHGVVLADAFELLPELAIDVESARAVFELLLARGPHAVLADWDAGKLKSPAGGAR